MEASRCVIHGKVRGKPRPRFAVRGGHAVAYTTREEREYEAMVAREYVAQGGVMHEGPISVRIDTFRALPKGRPKRVESEPDVHKPDVDNCCKAILDSLNGVAWADDAQVTSLSVTKHDRTRRDECFVVTVSERRMEEE